MSAVSSGAMPNSLSNKHPQYGDKQADWGLMRDSYKGERAVKQKRDLYLPATSGHIQDGFGNGSETVGTKAYNAYMTRARFPNFVREAVQMAIGMMHSQPPKIQLPEAMSGIRSSKGETLEDLLRRINTEQLVTGRVGLMADLPTNPRQGEDLPYLTTYIAERIINWDDGSVEGLVPQELNLVVLNESENERTDIFNWELKEKYRILIIGVPDENNPEGLYQQGVFEERDYSVSGLITPSWRGRNLKKMPFVIINSADLTNDVDEPPLLDLGNMCMTIYRGDADYRQNLFMQGQDTFVTIGGGFDETDAVRVGGGSRIDVPQGGDAKYVGVNSQGLAEQRQALENLERRAGSMGAQTLDTTSRERESGDSLRIRVAARTADMNQIVEVGAKGLEDILKRCAEWMGEDPEQVSVVPNKEFGEAELTGQTMVEIATARNLGWPISARSMHTLARKRRMTELSFEEEMEIASQENDDEDFVFRRLMTGDQAAENQNDDGPPSPPSDE